MKRFYREAAVVPSDAGFRIELDGKPVRTPGKAALAMPSRGLAEAIAAEWQSQGQEVRLQDLPLTRIAGTAIDLIVPRHEAVAAEIAQYGGTDLLCYRASEPPELVERQQREWQPLLDWAALRFDAPLRIGNGVLPIAQPPASLKALAAALATYDSLTLAALNLAVRALGSLVLGLALIEERIDTATAFAAAQLDESFEIEQWGEDAEQERRRQALFKEIALAARFAALARG